MASCFARFGDEFRAHVEQGGCPFPDSPLDGILAPVVQHARHQFHRELEVVA